jgi:hypothetical protein
MSEIFQVYTRYMTDMVYSDIYQVYDLHMPGINQKYTLINGIYWYQPFSCPSAPAWFICVDPKDAVALT